MLNAVSCFPSWWSRFLFFLLCFPLLLPLLFLSIPLLCALEIFSRLRSRFLKSLPPSAAADEDGLRLRRCEEGYGDGGVRDKPKEDGTGLLHRYLDDQLILATSIFDCGKDDENEGQDLSHDQIRVPLLSFFRLKF